MADLRDQLGKLERRIDALSDELAMANAQLAKRERRDTMKARVRCPSCDSRSILHVPMIVDRDGGLKNPMAVTMKGLFMPKPVGQFECYVCRGCGLVEWYVANPGELDQEGEVSRLVDIEDRDNGPYR